MFGTFEQEAKGGVVSKEAFPVVLAALFEDKTHEQVAQLLENPYFMERTFDFLDKGSKGSLTHEDFERVSLMFSSDSDELSDFRFFVYDAGCKGYIVKDDMVAMIRSWFETGLKIKERELKLLVADNQADVEDVEAFARARKELFGEKKLAEAKIEESVAFAFATTVRQQPERISREEFLVATAQNDDLFDMRGIAEDLLEYLDDLTRLV